MHRCSRVHYGVFAVLVEEIKKMPAYLSHKASEGAKTYVHSASKAMEFLKGEDPNEDPAMRGKRRQHREMYHAILRDQAAKEQERVEQRRASLSWKEKLQFSFREAKEGVLQMTSAKAGVMALLQHCTASHAAEVALEEGIDVKNVQMVFEKAVAKNSVGYEEVVVGYIDAPAASREKVMAFAEKLHKACPVAKSMHIEWRQGNAGARSQGRGSAGRGDRPQRETEHTDREMEWAQNHTSSSPSEPTSSADAALKQDVGNLPAGMPGSRRGYSSMLRSPSRGGGSGSLQEDEGKLHFPDLKGRDIAWEKTSCDGHNTKHPSNELSAASHAPPSPPASGPASSVSSSNP
ncbi:hypothetical protein LSCM1_02191 [Leishmania martiniquensis]|uniref:OsmC-like protein n=1 Tax=Leishmania martiniquensis TaxID=1580590 RepID=A0A836K9G0_9TRYP|nr:hypothetical protein LSCM1_02191 [Leishmania martiniquensis]